MAYVVFKDSDFKLVQEMAGPDYDIPIRVWTRSNLAAKGLSLPVLDMTVKIFNELLDIFRNVDPTSIPPKIGTTMATTKISPIRPI